MTASAPPSRPAPAGSPPRLSRRSEFLRVAEGGYARHAPTFRVQAARHEDERETPARFGFTVTRKVAGSVGRNRIRRRLREALRLGGALTAKDGFDYVFIAKRDAIDAPFEALVSQMREALERVVAQRRVNTKPAGRRAKNEAREPQAGHLPTASP